LSKNWPAIFEQNIRTPKTVDEAVDRLITILDGEQKATVAAARKT